MKLIARKPCSFNGQKFFVGDDVPAELVANPKVQERRGVLAILNTDADMGTLTADAVAPLINTSEMPSISVLIPNKENPDSGMSIPLSVEDAESIFRIMQMNLDEATEYINVVENENILIVLDACDSRKGIKTASAARAAVLNLAAAGIVDEAQESVGDK